MTPSLELSLLFEKVGPRMKSGPCCQKACKFSLNNASCHRVLFSSFSFFDDDPLLSPSPILLEEEKAAVNSDNHDDDDKFLSLQLLFSPPLLGQSQLQGKKEEAPTIVRLKNEGRGDLIVQTYFLGTLQNVDVVAGGQDTLLDMAPANLEVKVTGTRLGDPAQYHCLMKPLHITAGGQDNFKTSSRRYSSSSSRPFLLDSSSSSTTSTISQTGRYHLSNDEVIFIEDSDHSEEHNDEEIGGQKKRVTHNNNNDGVTIGRESLLRRSTNFGIDFGNKNNTTGSAELKERNLAEEEEPLIASSLQLSDSGFALFEVQGLTREASEGCLGVTLDKLICGTIQSIFISNYLIDMGFLISFCPALLGAKSIIIAHGCQGEDEASIRQVSSAALSNCFIFRPPLPIPYGTHHSKFFLVQYQDGLRVIIHTANLIYCDCLNKSQGIWWQDFPRKQLSGNSHPQQQDSPSPFEKDLIMYLSALKLPQSHQSSLLEMIRAHDFTAAKAVLIGSVPGYHHGPFLHSYGHMKMRNVLCQQELPLKFHSHPSPIVAQCSSLGSISEAWLEQFFASLDSSSKPQQLGQSNKKAVKQQSFGVSPDVFQFIWPTVEEVRLSIEGWAAGGSIPGKRDNVQKPFLQKYLCKWDGGVCGRERAMPHMKSYLKYSCVDHEIAWLLITSHNLSGAAWGVLQKNDQQLFIRSYELGVLLLPSVIQRALSHPNSSFVCKSHSDCMSPLLQRCSPPQGVDVSEKPIVFVPLKKISSCAKNPTLPTPVKHVLSSTQPSFPAPLSSPPSSLRGSPPSMCSSSSVHLAKRQKQSTLDAEQDFEEHHEQILPSSDHSPLCSSSDNPWSSSIPRHLATSTCISLPLPYPLPPIPYSQGQRGEKKDEPWMNDVLFLGVDSLGYTLGSHALEKLNKLDHEQAKAFLRGNPS